jgi:hypothetical protein
MPLTHPNDKRGVKFGPRDRPESYVTECLIMARDGDIPFTLKEDGEMLAALKGYAILPIERYLEITQESLPEKPDYCRVE